MAYHAFIQAVLLTSVFKQRLSFLMFYFRKNNHKIVAKCRWGSQSVASSATVLWWRPGGGSGGKAPDHFGLLTSGGKINS